MKLTFLGAAREVTGSCSLLEAAGKKLLIDCGMQQGPELYERQDLPCKPSEIDAVFVTHAHIDHSGLLPLLFKNGYVGKIYLTEPAKDLCKIMLADSAHIQEFEAEWRNRKAKRANTELYTPLYDSKDVEGVIPLLRSCVYYQPLEVFKGITVTFIDAGHMLGSASICLTITEEELQKTLIFSGDIGNFNKPIIRDPELPVKADFVVMESTYGDRSHGAPPDYVKELTDVLQRTFDRGGSVVIPSFAVGRMQELLYFLREIKTNRLIKGHEDFPVYVDSPLAVEATKIFSDYKYDCYDENTLKLLREGINPLRFDGLRTSVATAESKAINFDTSPKVILSASGMCEAGRIRHHLKHNLWNINNTILFVGYQVDGTIGRKLLDGATEIKLFGETISCNAEIFKLAGISSHADDNGLLKWVNNISPKPTRVFVNHGEESVTEIMCGRLKKELGLSACAPYPGDCWDLINNVQSAEGSRTKVKKIRASSESGKTSAVFEALLAAGKRLMDVIMRNKGGSNRDIRKFTKELDSLSNRWHR